MLIYTVVNGQCDRRHCLTLSISLFVYFNVILVVVVILACIVAVCQSSLVLIV